MGIQRVYSYWLTLLRIKAWIGILVQLLTMVIFPAILLKWPRTIVRVLCAMDLKDPRTNESDPTQAGLPEARNYDIIVAGDDTPFPFKHHQSQHGADDEDDDYGVIKAHPSGSMDESDFSYESNEKDERDVGKFVEKDKDAKKAVDAADAHDAADADDADDADEGIEADDSEDAEVATEADDAKDGDATDDVEGGDAANVDGAERGDDGNEGKDDDIVDVEKVTTDTDGATELDGQNETDVANDTDDADGTDDDNSKDTKEPDDAEVAKAEVVEAADAAEVAEDADDNNSNDTKEPDEADVKKPVAAAEDVKDVVDNENDGDDTKEVIDDADDAENVDVANDAVDGTNEPVDNLNQNSLCGRKKKEKDATKGNKVGTTKGKSKEKESGMVKSQNENATAKGKPSNKEPGVLKSQGENAKIKDKTTNKESGMVKSQNENATPKSKLRDEKMVTTMTEPKKSQGHDHPGNQNAKANPSNNPNENRGLLQTTSDGLRPMTSTGSLVQSDAFQIGSPKGGDPGPPIETGRGSPQFVSHAHETGGAARDGRPTRRNTDSVPEKKPVNTSSKIGVWHIAAGHLNASDESFEDTRPIILFAHDSFGTRAEYYRVRFYKALGKKYHVITFDYRGFGDSKPINEVTEESMMRDVLDVYNDTKERAPECPIVLWGHGLGSGIVAHTVANLSLDGPPDIAGVILTGAFYNLTDLTKNHRWFLWAGKKFYENILFDSLRTSGFELCSSQHVLDIATPLSIVHADDDTFVPFSSAFRLYEQSKRRTNGSLRQFYGLIGDRGLKHSNMLAAPELLAIVDRFVARACSSRNEKNLNYISNSQASLEFRTAAKSGEWTLTEDDIVMVEDDDWDHNASHKRRRMTSAQSDCCGIHVTSSIVDPFLRPFPVSSAKKARSQI